MDKYYIKQLDRRGDAPNWAVYERTDVGARAVCLCYDEATAERIMRLLILDENRQSEGDSPTLP